VGSDASVHETPSAPPPRLSSAPPLALSKPAQPLIDASWAPSSSRRSFSSSTTAFHSGWCNANPSDPCRRGITRLCPCVTGSASALHSASSFSRSTHLSLQRAEQTTVLAMGVAGLQAAEVCGALLGRQTAIAFAGIAAEAEGLQVAEVVRAALVPGHDGSISRARWCGVCQATARPAAFAAAFGAGEHPVFDRASDRLAVANTAPTCGWPSAGLCRQGRFDEVCRSLSPPLPPPAHAAPAAAPPGRPGPSGCASAAVAGRPEQARP